MEKRKIKNAIKEVYQELRALLSLYVETDCFNKVPEGEVEEDPQEFISRRIGEIRKSVESLFLGERKFARKLNQIIDETEHFTKQYARPGVVIRWKQINPQLLYFEDAFEIMENNPELYLKMRRGLTNLRLSCYPDSELVAQRDVYFTKAKEDYERNNLEYSEERIFQDELLNTLTLLFEDEFKEGSRIWSANSVIAKVIGENSDKIDCIFYFIVRGGDKTLTLKEDIQKAVGEHMAEVVDVQFYSMRSGPGVRSSLVLKDEWSDLIPEQVNIVFVNRETEDATLLSQAQRDMFFDMVLESTEDLDTVFIAEYVLNEIDADEEHL